MNGVLGSVWKEVVVVYCRYCNGNWLKGLRTTMTKNFSLHVDDLAEIRTKHLLNVRKGLYCYTKQLHQQLYYLNGKGLLLM